MDRNQFEESLKWMNRDLIKLEVNRVFNSLGWNLFLEFGNSIEILLPNGKKDLRKEWIVWIGNASWRMTRNQRYYIGSDEDIEINLQEKVQILLRKRFVSAKIISKFLDLEIELEEGCKITTFFNWKEESQWVVFFPNKTEVSVNFSSDEEIRQAEKLGRHLKIESRYKKSDFPLTLQVDRLVFDDYSFSILFSKNVMLKVGESAWRLTKNEEYILGKLDCRFGSQKPDLWKTTVAQLKDKKIESIDIGESGMDVILHFDSGHSLEVFTIAQRNQWELSENGKPKRM